MLTYRLRDEERKASATTARLRTLEQRARFLETAAAAARQRADAGARKVTAVHVHCSVTIVLLLHQAHNRR